MAPRQSNTGSRPRLKRRSKTTSARLGYKTTKQWIDDTLMSAKDQEQKEDLIRRLSRHIRRKALSNGVDLSEVLKDEASETGELSYKLQHEDIKIGLSDDIGVPEVTRMRDALAEQLAGAETLCLRNGVYQAIPFTTTEIESLVKFFVNDMMGLPAIARIENLLRDHQRYPQKEIEKSTAEAAQVNIDNGMAPACASFLREWSRLTIHANGGSTFAFKVLSNLDRLELLPRYNRIRESAKKGRGGVRKSILSGLPGAGSTYDWEKQVIPYLARELRVPKVDVQDTLAASRTIETLTTQYGRGILVLLPPGAVKYFISMGEDKMGTAIRCLSQHFPRRHLADISDWLNDWILGALRQGTEIKVTHLGKWPWLSFHNRILTAEYGKEANFGAASSTTTTDSDSEDD